MESQVILLHSPGPFSLTVNPTLSWCSRVGTAAALETDHFNRYQQNEKSCNSTFKAALVLKTSVEVMATVNDLPASCAAAKYISCLKDSGLKPYSRVYPQFPF